MILKGNLTYAQVVAIDPEKFVDLEVTMRMLYDHSEQPEIAKEDDSALEGKEPKKNPIHRKVSKIRKVQRPRL